MNNFQITNYVTFVALAKKKSELIPEFQTDKLIHDAFLICSMF